MIQGAIFDMDGLMFDTEPVWGRCWTPAFARFGYEPPSPKFRADLRGTAGATMGAVFRRYLGPDVDFEGIYEAERQLVQAETSKHLDKKPGLDHLLSYLAAHGVPMAVASSSPQELIEKDLRTAGVDTYFSQVVSSFGMARSKPFPDVFLEAARRLETDPAHSMVLEDSYNGVRAGEAGGFVTIMVPDQEPADDEMHERATAVCESLDDVIGLIESGKLG